MATSVTRRIQQQQVDKKVEKPVGKKTAAPKRRGNLTTSTTPSSAGKERVQLTIAEIDTPGRNRRDNPRRTIWMEALCLVIEQWNDRPDVGEKLTNAELVSKARMVGSRLNDSAFSSMLNGRKDFTGDSLQAILLALRELDPSLPDAYLHQIRVLLPNWTSESGKVTGPSKRRMNEHNCLSLHIKMICKRENLTKEAFFALCLQNKAINEAYLTRIWDDVDYVPKAEEIIPLSNIIRMPGSEPYGHQRELCSFEYFQELFAAIADRVASQRDQRKVS